MNLQPVSAYPQTASDRVLIDNVSYTKTLPALTLGSFKLGPSYSGTLTLGGPLTIDNSAGCDGSLSLLCTGGNALNVGNYPINISGNYNTQSGAQITLNQSTVTFVGTSPSTIFGDNTFYNFKCTTPGKVLDFDAGRTQTINGNFLISGSAQSKVSLCSAIDGTRWNLRLNGTKSISNAFIKDSNLSLIHI